MLCCVVDSNPYQLSCPGSSVGRALAWTTECRGFESHPGQLFFYSLKIKAVLGVVDLPRAALRLFFEKKGCPGCS